MHSIARRDEMWGGWSEKTVGGGGGGRLLCANLYMSRVKWYDNTHKLFNPIKKGLLLTAIQIRGTAETRRCVADAVRLQVITLNAPLTLRASYLPLPPPQLLPLFSYLSLITVLVAPAHGIQGCFNTTSFDKNYWHFNFAINPLCSSFFFTASFPYIFRNTPCWKNAPSFFCQSSIQNLFSRFFLCCNFSLLFNEYANYLHRRKLKPPY